MRPNISIVMGVYNGEATLRETIQSIIAQTFSGWEFIVVDDASTDSTRQILESYAEQDSRFRVVRQPQNRGLTCALIEGCKEARGEFIARQDNGDYAFPQRLSKQLAFLEQNPEVVAVSCGVRRIGPRREFLGDVIRNLTPRETTRVFLDTGKSIVHATAMIRKSAYDSVAGYRSQFRVAQDIDLWYQLIDVGLIAEIPEALAHIAIELNGISAMNTHKQQCLARIARQLYENRYSNSIVHSLLQEAACISHIKTLTQAELHQTTSLGAPSYFIGSELYALRNAACRTYLRQAILNRHRIAHSFFKFIISYLTCTKKPTSPRSTCANGQS